MMGEGDTVASTIPAPTSIGIEPRKSFNDSRPFSLSASLLVSLPGLTRALPMRKPAPPAVQRTVSSRMPCGRRKARNGTRRPWFAQEAIAAPRMAPFTASMREGMIPRVIPEPKRRIVTLMLLVVIQDVPTEGGRTEKISSVQRFPERTESTTPGGRKRTADSGDCRTVRAEKRALEKKRAAASSVTLKHLRKRTGYSRKKSLIAES